MARIKTQAEIDQERARNQALKSRIDRNKAEQAAVMGRLKAHAEAENQRVRSRAMARAEQDMAFNRMRIEAEPALLERRRETLRQRLATHGRKGRI